MTRSGKVYLLTSLYGKSLDSPIKGVRRGRQAAVAPPEGRQARSQRTDTPMPTGGAAGLTQSLLHRHCHPK